MELKQASYLAQIVHDYEAMKRLTELDNLDFIVKLADTNFYNVRVELAEKLRSVIEEEAEYLKGKIEEL